MNLVFFYEFYGSYITSKNSDQIGGPWIPSFQILKFGPIRPSMDPCLPH